jgi:hypothetical protein
MFEMVPYKLCRRRLSALEYYFVQILRFPLDSKTGRDVVNIIQKLAKDTNCAILLVTHDNRILYVADRIV